MRREIPYTTWRWQLRPLAGDPARAPAPQWVEKGTNVRVLRPEVAREFAVIVRKQNSVRDRGLGSSNL